MKPLMTDKPVGIKNVLLVGNSFMFYNCGVNGMINGFAKAKHRDLVITGRTHQKLNRRPR